MSEETRPRLLLVPAFTELEWGIRARLEEWAEVASFDMPGMGDEPLPPAIQEEPSSAAALLPQWRTAGVAVGLRILDELGWEEFFVVTDDLGAPTAVAIARARIGDVLGLALGHAALSHSTEGERAAMNRAVWDVMAQLARQGSEQFVRYGIAQATQGGISPEVAQQMVERFPDMSLVAATFDALSKTPEPIGDDLIALGVPLLLAKHDGCLGRTDEGFEDIVAAFPRSAIAICPEACSASPTFAEALRRFCGQAAGASDAVD